MPAQTGPDVQPTRLPRSAAEIGALGLLVLPVALCFSRYLSVYVVPHPWLAEWYRAIALVPADGVVLIVTGAGLIAGWRRWRGPWGPAVQAVFWAGTALVAIALATVAVAYQPGLAAGFAAHLALLNLFVLAVAIGIRPSTALRPALASLVSLLGILALWQVLTQSTAPAGRFFLGWEADWQPGDLGASVIQLGPIDRWLRAYGPFAHPNVFGAFLLVTLPWLLFRPRGADPAGPFHTLAAALGGVALGLTFSRAALVGSALMVGAYLALRPSRARAKRWRWAGAGVLAGLALAATPRLLAASGELEQNAITGRLFGWEVALEAAQSLGVVGAGNLVLAQQLLGRPERLADPPHSAPLILFAELGPAGLLAALGLAGAIGWAIWRARRQPDGLPAGLAVIGLLPFLLVDHYFWTQPPGRTLVAWAIVLLLQTLAPAPTQPAIDPTNPP